eukprot:CAMPEP_0177647946 /NCGR_PEP_ID=MMETSP0447-20121125/10567_1 /TAXON_ID=0 /ORGANISM="Stygamoeba regulata, Strain BSH-02190019" /LENGTH=336 /DNA_ID=CAMNT_0019150557 /DNA_START=128 /DNA_END=1138 /DNA_ORIENTATION=+
MGLTASKPLTVPATSEHFHALVAKLPRMDGKVVAVTGSTSGLGLVCARVCGSLGARVLLLNRDSARATAAVETLKSAGVKDVRHVSCDLQSFASVRKAAESLQSLCADSGIDVLCNNAGVMGLPNVATQDGYDVQMQTNHLSHFLLTLSVWPLLERAAAQRGEARVVNHSSGARKKPGWALDARYLGRNGGQLGTDWNPLSKWTRYQQSKLANLLFTYGLHTRAQAAGSPVKVVCAHPGATLTDLQLKTAQAGGTSLIDYIVLSGTMKNAHSEEDGTEGIIMGCAAAGVQSGEFYGPEGLTGPAVLLPAERNETSEEMLWRESAKETGVDFPATRQ